MFSTSAVILFYLAGLLLLLADHSGIDGDVR